MSMLHFCLALIAVMLMTSNALSMNKMPLKFDQIPKSVELIHTIDALKSEESASNIQDPLKSRNSLRKNKGESGSKVFGFTLASEIINGRLAMVGIAIGLMNEIFSGKSLLQQIGLTTQPQQASFVIAMIILSIAASLNIPDKKNQA